MVLALKHSFSGTLIVGFSISQGLFHITLASLMIMMRVYFRRVEDNLPLGTVGLANSISLVRISLVPLAVALVLAIKTHDVSRSLIAVLVLAFASDALDGFVARTRHETTFIGKILDSSSDYTILFTVSLALCIHGALPVWLFAGIGIRLGLQATGMFLLHCRISRLHPESTLLGKVTVAVLMLVLVLESFKLIRCLCLPAPVFLIAELVLALVLAVSCIDKVLFFKRAFSQLEG